VNADGERPYGYAFWALGLASLLCYCNLAIFYGYYTYLEGLGIPAAWRRVAALALLGLTLLTPCSGLAGNAAGTGPAAVQRGHASRERAASGAEQGVARGGAFW
jgi:hypothetical protein